MKLPIYSLLAFLPLAPAKGAVTFEFTYTTNADQWVPDARNALENAAGVISGLLVNYDAVVPIEVRGATDATPAGSQILASARANYVNTVSRSTNNTGLVAGTILGTTTIEQGEFAGTIDANFAQNWSFGNMVAANEFDFTSTMIHELTHALGFVSLIAQNGTSAVGTC